MFECVFDFRSKDLSMDRQSSMPTKHNNKNWSCRTASTFGSECYVLFCLCTVFYWFSKCVVFMPTLSMCSAQQAVYLFNIVKNFENFFNI